MLIEVMMHPTIEILNISHQGYYDELNNENIAPIIYKPPADRHSQNRVHESL